MAVRLTDMEIRALLAEGKPTPADLFGQRKVQSRPGHTESYHPVTGQNGSAFEVRVRQSKANPFDFSVILMHQPAGSSEWFRLRRYNGNSHTHTNKIEKDTMTSFHRHTATERYQQLGTSEDAFAEPINSYADVNGAIQTLIAECGFIAQPAPQPTLFDDEE